MALRFKIFPLLIFFLLFPFLVSAHILGEELNFNISSSYDLEKREETTAILEKITNQIYFYLDKNWWQGLSETKKREIDKNLYNLSTEFEYKIYPTLTSTFGSEPKPGIDNDERITVLIHPMKKEAGGYFNSGDVYSKSQNPKSNQREMIYLNAQYADEDILKNFLSHEFTHLITINQKDLLRKVQEEIWLNEARAEYALTFLGYDNVDKNSTLEKRVKEFLENPQDSLTEWQNKTADYGVVNLFTQYLVDHYGVKILADSLKSNKVGIPSIDEALKKNGFVEDFSQVFTNFAIAVLVNDCQQDERYCYKNENLKKLKITPAINFLPSNAESVLSIFDTAKEWSLDWQKIIGGKGNLTLEFDGADEINFKVPYLLYDYQGQYQINFLKLDEKQRAKIFFPNYDKKYSALIFSPLIQDTKDLKEKKNSYSFSFKITTSKKADEEMELKKQLLAQIDSLKKEIARLEAQIQYLSQKKINSFSCQKFENNLYYGIKQNSEVRCLQEFLKTQGPEIYPQGLITGNFLSLTREAVIRFQEKYADEILIPLGLLKGTGYFGSATRTKANQLLVR